MTKRMHRRAFLKYSLMTGVFIWAGDQIPNWLGIDSEVVDALFSINPASASTPSVFPQSVASGDPRPNGITLWTRVAPGPGRARVAVEVASDPAFRQRVLRGITETTDASRDYTVKFRLTSAALRPFQTYYYRFIYRGTSSRVGRFKTLPAANAAVERVRFAYLSCQDYTNGYYTAFPYLAQENIDFIVHLGDYIYETVSDPSFQGAQVRTINLPSGRTQAETLDDYRFIYKTYRSDRNLQRIHEQFAFISIWDDHEFANDSYREFDTDTTNEQQNRDPQRRQAANQAWAEYTPTNIPFNADRGPLESLRIYRSFVFGNLMELVMTDERLYRDGPPCGLGTQNRVLTPGCADLSNPNRTMLGATQRQWFLNKIKGSSRIWKVWGNETMVMQLKLLSTFTNQLLGVPVDLFINLDQWDGYPAERALLFNEFRNAGVRNLVTITGDLHTFIAGYQKVDYNNPAEPPVSVCFMGGSVTSSNLAELATGGGFGGAPVPPSQVENLALALQASNPHIQFFNSSTHGYNLVEVTPQAFTCTMKAVDTVRQPQAQLFTLKRFRVPRNRVVIEEL